MKEEIRLLRYSQYELFRFLKKNVVDIGPGDGSKAIALFGIDSDSTSFVRDKEFTYIASDSSPAMMRLARRNIEAKSNNSNISFGNSQVMEGSRSLTNYLPDTTYLWLGGTIGNFSDEQIVHFLR